MMAFLLFMCSFAITAFDISYGLKNGKLASTFHYEKKCMYAGMASVLVWRETKSASTYFSAFLGIF